MRIVVGWMVFDAILILYMLIKAPTRHSMFEIAPATHRKKGDVEMKIDMSNKIERQSNKNNQ